MSQTLDWSRGQDAKSPGSRLPWKKDAPDGDRYLTNCYNSLQVFLSKHGFPETIDRTTEPRTSDNNEHVNVVILSVPAECIDILLEGGNHIPDGFHLALAPTWLSKAPMQGNTTMQTLSMHKSISFHNSGVTFMDVFEPPREVTYFMNSYTDKVTRDELYYCNGIEKHLQCPVNSSVSLWGNYEDPILSRGLMADVGLEIPETLAFGRMDGRAITSSEREKLKVVMFDGYADLDKNNVVQEITTFSKRLHNLQIGKVIVRPSGVYHNGKEDVSLHSTSDVPSIVKAFDELLMKIDKGCSVIVEECVQGVAPLDISEQEETSWSDEKSVGFCVNTIVCRDDDNTPVTTNIICTEFDNSFSNKSDAQMCKSLDSILLAHNVLDKHVRENLETYLRTKSAEVLQLIMDKENMLNDEENGTGRAQTDVIGLELILTARAGKLIPVGIEVKDQRRLTGLHINDTLAHLRYKMTLNLDNDSKASCNGEMLTNGTNGLLLCQTEAASHTATKHIQPQPATDSFNSRDKTDPGNIQEGKYLYKDLQDHTFQPLVRNMIARSQRYLMNGKRVVVIGGGVIKGNIWSDAAGYGIKVILVDSNPNHPARDIVHHFIIYDFDDHQNDLEHARNILNIIQAQGIMVDGCLTFCEDSVPLASLLCEMMGTKGSSYQAALIGKKKSRTQEVLESSTGDLQKPETSQYSSKSVLIKSEEDCLLVSKSMNFPVMFKLEHGFCAVGASVVKSEAELIERYHEVTESLRTQSDFPGIGLGFDSSMVAMEFHQGYEHDVDIIMCDKKLVHAFVTDNGPVRLPFFTETAVISPSSLLSDKQAHLIEAAYQCSTEIGLTDGVFNVELLTTKAGPKLIEINARMGGYYVRDLIRKVHKADLMLCAVMVACGVKPYVPVRPPKANVVGIMLMPSLHSHIVNESYFKHKLSSLMRENDIIFTQLHDGNNARADDYEIPFAHIAVSAASTQDAKCKLMDICKALEIRSDSYKVENFLK